MGSGGELLYIHEPFRADSRWFRKLLNDQRKEIAGFIPITTGNFFPQDVHWVVVSLIVQTM